VQQSAECHHISNKWSQIVSDGYRQDFGHLIWIHNDEHDYVDGEYILSDAERLYNFEASSAYKRIPLLNVGATVPFHRLN